MGGMATRRPSAISVRKITLLCILGLAIGLVAGAGVLLANTQAAAKDKLRSDYVDRSKLTADLAGGMLDASDGNTRAFAEQSYSGAASEMAAVAKTADHTGLDWVVILGADGAVLGTDPPSLAADAGRMGADPGFALAMQSGTLVLSNVAPGPHGPIVEGFQPFTSTEGRRMLVASIPAKQIVALLSNALEVRGSRSCIVDSHGKVIVSSDDAPVGQPLSKRSLATASARAGQGNLGADFYVSTAVPHSNWHVIFTTSERSLLAPVQSTARVAWVLFGAFAGSMILLLLIGAAALISSARLARARLYDVLTGLPNRSLFIDQTQLAIAERRQTGPLAALFIDLDGFKPVNDTYGHAVGDALLKAVSHRLVESMRPGDYVSRFGGDEFLILSKGLRAESDSCLVAERIQKYIAEPFEIDGKTISVGTSIGIAILDDHVADADALIHNADLAMYRAKQTGRGRFELFTPEMATSSHQR
jgi:diguanylate cyclase (GGDEF)-like protein